MYHSWNMLELYQYLSPRRPIILYVLLSFTINHCGKTPLIIPTVVYESEIMQKKKHPQGAALAPLFAFRLGSAGLQLGLFEGAPSTGLKTIQDRRSPMDEGRFQNREGEGNETHVLGTMGGLGLIIYI